MPSITFVLPHWLYWSGLLLFPLIAMFMLSRHNAQARAGDTHQRVSFGIGYFLLATAGFIGMHRLYLRNLKGLLFIPIFIALLLVNAEQRDSREAISEASNRIVKAEFFAERARKAVDEGDQSAAQKITEHIAEREDAERALIAAQATRNNWILSVRILALIILAGILFDAFRLPALVRHCRRLDETNPLRRKDAPPIKATASGRKINNESTLFAQTVGKVNNFAGTFVAYWSVIAVFVYYYEVIARYVFNSPTNWAHESMFLLFGAQYLIAGGFCMREDAHVRVDVFYMKFKSRTKALVDVATSAFFFIFMFSLLTAGWTFFRDSFEVREVSFTEWAIQYYPIKFTIALGALLLFLQGASKLLADIATVFATPAEIKGESNGI